jgi:transposase InsO family protein
MHTDLVLDALEQALWTRSDSKGVIHHSDRGCQYLSIRYTERLKEAGVEPSVGGVGDSYDNALAESVIGLFKSEVMRHRGPWRIAFAAFRPVVAGAGTALYRRLQRPTIEDRGRRLFLPAFGDSQYGAQIVDERFKDFSFDPSLRLLVNDRPGWQIVRHQTPGRTTTNYPAQTVEDLAQWKIALRSIFCH